MTTEDAGRLDADAMGRGHSDSMAADFSPGLHSPNQTAFLKLDHHPECLARNV
jgi:hypothetical protein